MLLDFKCRFQYTLAVIGAGVGIASAGYGLYKGIKSDSDKKKAEAEKAAMQRPFEKVQDEYYQNQNISKELASGGLPDATKNYIERENRRGITAGVTALENSGGDLNMISKLFDNYSNQTAGLASEDAQQHMRNIQYYTGVNKDIAGQKTIQYGVNELQPFENKLKELSERIKADKINSNNGYNQAIGSAAASVTSLSDHKWGKDPVDYTESPYIKPSTVSGILSTTGTDINTSNALAKYLTRETGSATFGRSKAEQDLFEGN